jgi:hypothetical protein
MNTTATRQSVDIAPQGAKPGLALILALLSVPGSTVAWELPAGGFWIGLPLALAAIVLATRTRRAGAGTRMATAAIVIAGLMLAMMVVWTAVELVGQL